MARPYTIETQINQVIENHHQEMYILCLHELKMTQKALSLSLDFILNESFRFHFEEKQRMEYTTTKDHNLALPIPTKWIIWPTNTPPHIIIQPNLPTLPLQIILY